MGQPLPDVVWGKCDDCDTFTRLFQFAADSELCLPCYRDVVEAVLEDHLQEGDDAAA